MAPNQIAQDRIDFFQLILEGFDRAARLAGTIDQTYRIGESTVLLRFAGTGMIPYVTPALGHLRAQDGAKPDLTIHVFDSVSTQSPLPLLAGSLVRALRNQWWDMLGPRREIREYTDDRIRAAFHSGPGFLRLLDMETDQAVFWIEDAAEFPYYERAYPLTSILNWWFGARGYHFVHAAAIGTAENGVLLPNKGGCGKSTTTIKCILSGMTILGDDYCIVTADSDHVEANSIYNSVKIESNGDFGRFFPELQPFVVNWPGFESGEEKAVVFLNDHFPERLITKFPVKAIMIPQLTGQTNSTITPASAALAMRALAPSTMLQLPGNERKTFQWLSQLVRTLPCYTLGLGTDVDQIPMILSDFLNIPERIN